LREREEGGIIGILEHLPRKEQRNEKGSRINGKTERGWGNSKRNDVTQETHRRKHVHDQLGILEGKPTERGNAKQLGKKPDTKEKEHQQGGKWTVSLEGEVEADMVGGERKNSVKKIERQFGNGQ